MLIFAFNSCSYLGDGRFHLEAVMIANPSVPAYRLVLAVYISLQCKIIQTVDTNRDKVPPCIRSFTVANVM